MRFVGRYGDDQAMSHLWLVPIIVPQVDPLQRSYAFRLNFYSGQAVLNPIQKRTIGPNVSRRLLCAPLLK